VTTPQVKPAPVINVYWEGTIGDCGSMARTNRELCLGLARRPLIDLTILPYELTGHSERMETASILSPLDIRKKRLNLRQLQRLPSVCVRHRWPVQAHPPPRHLNWVIFQPWEYSVLTCELAETFQRSKVVWTTSAFCRDSFIRSGLDPERVSILPLGVDTDRYQPVGRTLQIPTERLFRFVFVGGTIYRKGLDILLRAYRTAFGPSDDVYLIIKDFGTGSIYRGQTSEGMIREFQGNPAHPEVVYLDDELPEPDLAALYRGCDAFVSSYRGEGFAMPVLEAMSCGLPVIVTDGGATDDFCDEAVGWKIKSEARSVGHSIYGKPTPREAFFLEPSVRHLAELMRNCFEASGEVSDKGHAARDRAQHWSWARSAARAVELLEDLTGVQL